MSDLTWLAAEGVTRRQKAKSMLGDQGIAPCYLGLRGFPAPAPAITGDVVVATARCYRPEASASRSRPGCIADIVSRRFFC